MGVYLLFSSTRSWSRCFRHRAATVPALCQVSWGIEQGRQSSLTRGFWPVSVIARECRALTKTVLNRNKCLKHSRERDLCEVQMTLARRKSCTILHSQPLEQRALGGKRSVLLPPASAAPVEITSVQLIMPRAFGTMGLGWVLPFCGSL